MQAAVCRLQRVKNDVEISVMHTFVTVTSISVLDLCNQMKLVLLQTWLDNLCKRGMVGNIIICGHILTCFKVGRLLSTIKQ